MMTMNNFEEWYKDTYPGVDPELDDMLSQLKACFEAGYDSGWVYCRDWTKAYVKGPEQGTSVT